MPNNPLTFKKRNQFADQVRGTVLQLETQNSKLETSRRKAGRADQIIMGALKTAGLVILTLIVMGCAGAKQPKPAAPAPLIPSHVVLDPINETRAILKYDRGEHIEGDGQKRAEEEIKKFCNARKHKVLVEGERLSGEKKWTRIIVFECTE